MGRTIKILICDDSLIIRRRLSESIKICYPNVEIMEAADSYSAERLYMMHMPDLVFMDIILPDRNGIDTVKKLKVIDPYAKIIMISTAGTKANLFKAVGAGAFDFLQKPLEHATIERVIHNFAYNLIQVENKEQQEECAVNGNGETVGDSDEDDDLL